MMSDALQLDAPMLSAAAGSSQRARKSRLVEQRDIVNRALRRGTHLKEELAACSWSYDNLRYEQDEETTLALAKYRPLSEFSRKRHGVPVVSFFAGAGGADLGFEAAGYVHVAAVEISDLFCQTLRQNRPNWRIIGPPHSSGDVAKTESVAADLRKILGRARKFEGIFIGGPPCQPFSIAANQRFNKSGLNFKRVGYDHRTNGSLLFRFVDLIREFRPAAFLIENVPGLLDIDGGIEMRRALGALAAVGYHVQEPLVINAADHLVPQQRFRLFIVGTRRSKNVIRLKNQDYQVPCYSALRADLDGLPNHETRDHRAESVLRYMALRYGERDHLGRVDRLDPRLPSKTVIAGGTKGGGRSHLHPSIPRTLSVRECARLQTFPDDYSFVGPTARQFTQVGNAVPPVLAAQFAWAIKTSWFD